MAIREKRNTEIAYRVTEGNLEFKFKNGNQFPFFFAKVTSTKPRFLFKFGSEFEVFHKSFINFYL
ncbi:hypothetical protein JWG45_04090 [Leptospira sp. 201903070]|uniref:Uncharacterized protein n=1 Tax=Leptospira ainlahdjerensis TaxID=2810033 RepID=A0ABS2U7J5_9LEPT|nr:hypothetical protein [Leptospira ainlahdjerensis]MBM9576329.1 hypothetical protein [Leptospira ainlahdjerensis]